MTSPNINSQCLLSVFLLFVSDFWLFISFLCFILSFRVKYLKYSWKATHHLYSLLMISDNNTENQ